MEGNRTCGSDTNNNTNGAWFQACIQKIGREYVPEIKSILPDATIGTIAKQPNGAKIRNLTPMVEKSRGSGLRSIRYEGKEESQLVRTAASKMAERGRDHGLFSLGPGNTIFHPSDGNA